MSKDLRTKALIALICLFAGVPALQAQYLLNESFGDYATGNLKGQKASNGNKWTLYNHDYGTVYNPVQIEEQGLTYSGYADETSGKAMHLVTSSTQAFYNEGVSVEFAEAISSGTIYCAALMKFNAIAWKSGSDGSQANKSDYFLGFLSSTNGNNGCLQKYGCLFVQSENDGFKFGLGNANTIQNGYGNDVFSFGETYLVVFKYDFKSTGAADDEISVIVNPSVSAAEPVATYSYNLGADYGSAIRGLIFRQRIGQRNCYPDVYVDKVRVATSWNDLFGIGGSTGGGETTPAVTVDPTTIAFEGDCTIGQTYTKDILVKAENLKGDIAVATTADLSAAATIAKADAEAAAGYTLKLTLTPTSTETASGTVTLTAEGIEPVAISVTWTPKEAPKTPAITVTPNALAFEGNSNIGETYTKELVIKGANLTGDITVATTAELSAAATTITKAEAEAGYTLTVTLAPTSLETNTGTITLTSEGADTVEVPVSWTPRKVLPPTLLLREKFDYTLGNLYGQGGWVRNQTQGYSNASPIQVSKGGLTYAGYSRGAGNSVTLLKDVTDGEQLTRRFADENISSGAVYVSALINVAGVKANAFNTNAFFSLMQTPEGAVGDGNVGTSFCRLTATYAGDAYFRLGVGRNEQYGNATYGATMSSTSLNVNETYLVVMKYEFVDGDANDNVLLYVNPATDGVEPEAAQVTYSGTRPDATGLGGIALLQRSSDNAPQVVISDVRVANSWEKLFEVEDPIIPAVTVEPESIDFEGDCTIGETYTQNIVVKATDLKGDITVATTADLSATETISKEEAMAAEGYTLTVTLKPTSLETISGTITMTSEDATTVEIPVTWTPKEAIIPQIDATPKNPMFNNTGQVFTNETYTVDITVTGKDLKGDVTISSNHARVTASPAVVTKAEAEAEGGCKVTLTLQTDDSTEMQTAKITISTEGAEPLTLTTMWQAQAAPQYKEIAQFSDITAADIENQEKFKYTGEAIVTYYDSSCDLIYLQDDSRAITIQNYNWTDEVQRGDKLTNILFEPNGEGGFWSIEISQAPTVLASGQEAIPSIVTAAELKTDAAKYQNRLVRLTNVYVGWLVDDAFVDMQEGDQFTDLTSKPNAVKDADGTTLSIYVFEDANFVGQPMMSYANVTGISVSADGSMVAPRDLADFEALVDPNCIHNAQSGLVEVGKGCIRIHAAEAQVTLFDMVGNKLAETTATELSGLAPSVYLLQVTTADGTTVRKVFVK